MKKLFIVANWKSYKTIPEARLWLQSFNEKSLSADENKEIIVCPPFTFLPSMHSFITEQQLPIALGAQNVSPFVEGAYTGEVAATQLKEFVKYVVIGHSERRTYFSETHTMLADKVNQSLAAGLMPIFCVQGKETPIPEGVVLVAFEPVSAIGSGNPDTPDNANTVAEEIKKAHPTVQSVLYGGSVTAKNVHDFTKMPAIDGVLVGGASLDAEKFMQIIHAA